MSGSPTVSQAGLAMAPGPLMGLPFARVVAPPLISLVDGVGRVAAFGYGIATVLGGAGLVAALGAPAADPLTAFRYGILVISTLFVAAWAVCLAVLARPGQPTPVAAALTGPRPQAMA